MCHCLRTQESSLLVGSKSPSPVPPFGQAGLSHQGRGVLLHPVKVLRNCNPSVLAQVTPFPRKNIFGGCGKALFEMGGDRFS